MKDKPELIAFSENKLGGVQSYFFNLLLNDKEQVFQKRWILYNDKQSTGAKLPAMFEVLPHELFALNENGKESIFSISKRLAAQIDNKPGLILSSFNYELAALHLHRKKNKHIFFFCHDKEYLVDAVKFEFLIDAYVTHNIEYYEELQKLLPDRKKSILFLPYGICISGKQRNPNPDKPLNLLILSRITKNKGVFDLPQISRCLIQREIPVNWKIVGNGPELPALKEQMEGANVEYFNPESSEEVLDVASFCDLYLLPSRVDGLPNALLEAMSVGCVPVISEFNSGIRRVVTSKEGFVLPVGDIQLFCKTINKLHYNRQLLENMSANSKLKIENEFNAVKRTKEYYNVFKHYNQYKRPYQFKTFSYLGLSNHPLIPNIAKKIYSRFRINQ